MTQDGDTGGDRSGDSGGVPEHRDPRFVLERLGHLVVGRYLMLVSLIPLIVGSALLQGAWSLAKKQLDQRADRALYTGRAQGVVEDPWWLLDLEASGERRSELSAAHWSENPLLTARLCAGVRFTPAGPEGAAEEGAEETVAGVCRSSEGLSTAASILTWENALGEGVPVPWVDARGFPELRLSLSQRTAEWVRSFGPPSEDSFRPRLPHASPPPIDSEAMAALWDDLDDPFLRLLEEWSRPEPVVEVAYREDDPSHAMPAVYLHEAGIGADQGPDLLFVGLFGFFGAVAWGAGCRVATMGANRWIFLAVFLGTLALFPWWSRLLGPALGWVWGPAEEIADVASHELLGLRQPLELVSAEEALTREGVEVDWTLARSYYGPVFERVPVRPPERSMSDGQLTDDPLTDDEVLADLSAQVRARLAQASDGEVVETLGLARSIQEDRGEGEEVALLFVEAASEWCSGESRSEEVREAACALLGSLRFARPPENPYRLAVRERARLMALAEGAW